MALGASKDAPKRTRKPDSVAEQASRSQAHAKAAGDKQKKAVEAAAAARATFQASLLGGSRPRASGAGSSSQVNGHVEAAFESTEPAAAGDRAVGSAEPPADDVLEQGEGAAGSSGQQARAVA